MGWGINLSDDGDTMIALLQCQRNSLVVSRTRAFSIHHAPFFCKRIENDEWRMHGSGKTPRNFVDTVARHIASLSSDEFIPHPMYRQNELRMARVGFELLAQPRDVHIHGARRRHRIVAPDAVEQFVA